MDVARRRNEQPARFLEHVLDDRLSALYELAACAGLRRAEPRGLRWSDLDEDGAGMRVRQTIVVGNPRSGDAPAGRVSRLRRR